ncbi:MAG: COX15/CtaA family protein [Burkholderiales bacterium]|nr:COX15/CtaA family protein [Burkholderiales bacterium]
MTLESIRDDRRRPISLAALGGAALTFVVVVTSAFLRLTRAGLGCDDWPRCYGVPFTFPVVPVSPGVRFMQALHLLAAAGVAVLALATVALSLARPRRRATVVAAALAGALTLFLASIGRVTPGSLLPAVTLANVLGGMTLVAVFGWIALGERAAPGGAGPRRLAAAAAIALALLGAQIALGTLLSANFAARACAGIAECGLSPAEWNFAAFNPLTRPQPPAADAAADLPRRTLHMAHRWAGVLTAAWFLALAALMLRAGGVRLRALALALAGLPALQVILGLALVRFEVPLAAAVVHSGTSALLALAAVGALHHSRPAEAASVSAACQTVTSKQPAGRKRQR